MGDIAYTREEKVHHDEWVELRFEAADMLTHAEIFARDPEDYEPECTHLCGNPTLVFENDTIEVDEMWGVQNGRVFSSSFDAGISRWDEERGEYIKLFYGQSTPLGQFIAVAIREAEWLKDNLAKALGEETK